ncbi:MAG: hypothetical protein R3300_14225 [Candidatus Promineifilaceae bacterium]|nr:hypothetical protein [Candidatus Promineifilaceae bacterium]
MSASLRSTFLVHWIVSLLFGLPMLIAPGRLLGLFEWAPIDPITSRMYGAALLALAWGSFRGWRASNWAQVSLLVELEAAFTVLASIGLLRHLLFASYPWYVWAILLVMVLFAVAWIAALVRKSPE